MMSRRNRFLDDVMKRIRAGAPVAPRDRKSYARLDRSAAGVFAQVWFPTRGCSWERGGACTMCNYGHGSPVSAEAMVRSVVEAVASIGEHVDELFVSPSGSMLDPAEVPRAARRGIYECMLASEASSLCVETRPETVTTERIAELSLFFRRRAVAVELGLESCSPWIQRFCINRQSEPAAFVRAALALRGAGLRVYANVSVGPAFLSPSEAIEDATRSAEWALDQGADVVVLFPLHVKEHTLLEWLYDRGAYEPPSLWALVEVLSRLDPPRLSRVSISWYRANYGSGKEIRASPRACGTCEPRVLRLLDHFRAEPCETTLAPLVAFECDCKVRFRRSLATPVQSLPERVLEQYDSLAVAFDLTRWWSEQRPATRAALWNGLASRRRVRDAH